MITGADISGANFTRVNLKFIRSGGIIQNIKQTSNIHVAIKNSMRQFIGCIFLILLPLTTTMLMDLPPRLFCLHSAHNGHNGLQKLFIFDLSIQPSSPSPGWSADSLEHLEINKVMPRIKNIISETFFFQSLSAHKHSKHQRYNQPTCFNFACLPRPHLHRAGAPGGHCQIRRSPREGKHCSGAQA